MMAGSAWAVEPSECRNITIAHGGWTDNEAQNGFAAVVLKGLGYQTAISHLSIGVMLEGMKMGDVDAFLGIWTPNGDATVEPYLKAGAIRNVATNLTGAKYALAVPTYTYEEGLRSFQDIVSFRDKLDGKIHALEPGNDSNNVLVRMQEEKALGFETFESVESSEQGMLGALERAIGRKEPIVIVGWAPHPMNLKFDISYLSGGDEWFGPNYGSASVWTGLRPGYADACANALRLFQNLEFTPELLGAAMERILDEDATGEVVATDVLRGNPSLLDRWLNGVTTIDGDDAKQALRVHLGLN